MSTNANDFFQPDNYLAPMARDFQGLTGEQIEAANRTAINLQQTVFMLHGWANLDNSYIGGCRGNVKYRMLRRLSLIPIYPWPYKRIENRTSGHVLGDVIAGNVRVGTKQTQQTKSVADSVDFLLKAYGKMSAINRLDSLTTTSDEGRREAFMLFHAVMETRKDATIPDDPRLPTRAIDLPLEDLVDTKERGIDRKGFLTLVAPLSLRFAVLNGVAVPDYLLYEKGRDGRLVRSELFPEDVYEFRKEAFAKGMAMIAEIRSIVTAAYNMLVGPSGVLVRSRNQINAARMGQADSKMQKDDLDLWGERECPSFSWQTDVDRMREANAPVLNELRRINAGDTQPAAAVDQSEELRLLREQNAMLRKQQEETDARLASLESSRLLFGNEDDARASLDLEAGAGESAGIVAETGDEGPKPPTEELAAAPSPATPKVEKAKGPKR